MKIEILKVTEYKNIPIVIRRIGNIFEFIFMYKDKFYSKHNIFTIPFFRFKKDYTFIEKQNGAEVVLTQATATIDALLKNK